MEKKKNSKADLEKSKSIFFLVGLVVALGAVFAAFNMSTVTSNVTILERNDGIEFTDDVVISTEHKEVVKPIKLDKQVIELLNIVDDEEEDDGGFIIDSEANEETEIDYQTQIIVPDEEPEEEQILIFASTMPKFPGGEIGLRKYIAGNTKYPNLARESGIEGKVYVRFCVTSKGKVEKVSIARGVDPLLDKEALRVVKLLPKWKPGENGGRKVSVWYTVPINFQLK